MWMSLVSQEVKRKGCQDSNLRRPVPKTGVLPAELHPQGSDLSLSPVFISPPLFVPLKGMRNYDLNIESLGSELGALPNEPCPKRKW